MKKNMSNIELVVKIPKELYEAYKGKPPRLGDIGMDLVAQSIANGTPLPKGHGRIIDESQVTGTFTWDSGYIECYAPTIIKAESEVNR